MKVAELIKRLLLMPQDYDVIVFAGTEYDYSGDYRDGDKDYYDYVDLLKKGIFVGDQFVKSEEEDNPNENCILLTDAWDE